MSTASRTLLVTGGAGFIGANFVRYWHRHYPSDRIVVLDALTYAGNLANLESVSDQQNFQFVHGDILDPALLERLMQQERIDTIVHFAAESHVDRSIHDPNTFIQTNIVGTSNLLMAARTHWLDGDNAPATHRFHHVSTDEVYGSLGPNAPAFTEQTLYAPNSPYAASKAASDHLVRSYHHTYGLQVTSSNCSNNYGPYQFPEKLIPLMIVNAVTGQPLPIYGDGSNIRDWLYVEDHCRGIDLVLNKGRVGSTYNLGGNNEWRNIDIVEQLCTSVDAAFSTDARLVQRFSAAPAACGEKTESLITYVKDRPGHDQRYAIDATLAQTELGYKPQENFQTGFQLTLDWMLQNETWWLAVMDGSYRQWIRKNYSLAD